MKFQPLFSSALFAILVSSAFAAHAQPQAEPLELPTYVVDAPRIQVADQYIQASLNVLRAEARTPAVISLNLPAIHARVSHMARPMTALRLAKS
jgi:hypothetical protein